MNNASKSKPNHHVTVVIPTYNSGPFIHNALDSLTRQTMDQDLFEVIVINDHSTDNTKDVIHRYKKKIKNLTYLETTHNTGNPIAGRNMGIERAQGEYIHFIDHDDYIGDEALEKLYAAGKEWGSDVISGKNVSDNGGNYPVAAFTYGEVRSANPHTHPNIVRHLAPHRMYRTEFLREHNIKFDPEIVHGEDVYFTMLTYINAKTISIKTDYDYYHRLRRDDGKHLSTSQLETYGFYDTHKRDEKILRAIKLSENNDRDKVQWSKIYLENRCLQGDIARELLSLRPNFEIIHLINELILWPAGEDVLDSLDTQYQVLRTIARMGRTRSRKLFILSILQPKPDSIYNIHGRYHVKAYDNIIYDVSLMLKKFDLTINNIKSVGDKLSYDISASVETISSKNASYEMMFEDTDLDLIYYRKASLTQNDTLRFKISISHLTHPHTQTASIIEPRLIARAGDIIIPLEMKRSKVSSKVEKAINTDSYKVENKMNVNENIVHVITSK